MTKRYTRVLALLLVLLTLATGLLAGCKQTEETPDPTEPEVITTENQTDETEPPAQETEPPRTPGVYFVTVLPTANGTVTANCTEAKEGDQIALTVTPDTGYELISLTVNGQRGEEIFSMPAEDVFVVARFGYPEGVDFKEYPNGDFFGSVGTLHSSDVLDMRTDSGKNPYLVMDAGKATPLYAYVKGMTDDQFYLELTAKVTGIRSDEKYPKFGLMTNDGAEMVKFYLDMTTDKQVSTVGAVHQASGKGDDWAGQSTWKLSKALNLKSQTVKLALLRNGKTYYFYVNGVLAATGNDLSGRNAAAGIFSFGTSLKVTDYKLIRSENEINSLLNKAKADAEAFYAVALTENFFSKTAEGVYTLTTDSDAQHMVDDVTVAGKVMREKYYRVSGKLSLKDAAEWGQARILISADPQNEYFIALEKLGDGNYQIFTMSKANEEIWNNWELIASAVVNGSRNSIDFEIVVIGNQLYFLIDNEIFYENNRVSMTESTVKFTGFNVGTTTVENLSAEVFADAAAAEKYVSGKTVKDFGGSTLTGNYFTEVAEGVYTLTTDSDAQHKVDDVIYNGQTLREVNYRVSGKLSLTDAAEWGQARILISADPQNEYFIALEKLGDGNYQIFTMSKANEEGWNNWELIASGAENGDSNTIDFEVIVDADHLYFLIDNEIYYENSRVSMTESTVKFTGFNVGTTTVENLSAEIFENQDAAADYIATKAYKPEPEPTEPETTEPEITEPETQPEGEFFGTAAEHTSSNVLDMSTDSGETPYLVMDAERATPLYAYIKNLSEKQFYAEVTVQVTGIRADEGYPKFGFMTNDGDEMVKFYLDMNTEKQVGTVGAVHQASGGADDWAGQKTWQLLNRLDLTAETVTLSLLRDGKNYYFYVNGELEAVGNDLSDKTAAAGIFSFGTSLKLTQYSVIRSGDELDALISKALSDVEALSAVNLSTNYFTETAKGVYTLTTDSDAQHKVDNVRIGRNVMRGAYYSVKGNLTLTDADNWGQARILVSFDAQNEYFIALEKTGANSYQIFTMSKANEEGWNEWKLIESASHNGNRSVLDFELIVIGDQMYFLIEDEICYLSSRVSMTESTVKFTGYNVGTTTVKNLAVRMFADSSEAEAYAAAKNSRIGESFGVSEGTYFTTDGVSLANDKGDHATVSFVGGAPQYAYLHDLHTDKFCFETQVNVTAVLNNDGYPKFGITVNGSSEMVKFFVDMTPAMKATHVGVVYQPTGGGDDWANSRSVNVPGMAFTGSDTIKLKLVREGRAYYFYVNDNLVMYDENGFKAEKGAVGLFSFNAKLTASHYSVLTGSDANSAVQSAKDTVAAQLSKITLSTNWFADNGNGVYTLTTNSNAEHKVDDLNRGGNVLRTAYYSVKGKLTLTDAGNWGQARILISSDANNEYFIALERTDQGKFQIFTMSKRNRNYWYDWIEILHADVNGTRNSIDFELIVIGNRLYFLIDDTVVYSDTSVSLTKSTVKFTGYNVGTTTVENLSAEVFENRQDAESYLAEKTA